MSAQQVIGMGMTQGPPDIKPGRLVLVLGCSCGAGHTNSEVPCGCLLSDWSW